MENVEVKQTYVKKTSEKAILNGSHANTNKQILKHKPTNVGKMLSNNRRVDKHLTPPGFKPLTSRSITKCTDNSAIGPCFCFAATDFIIATSFTSE